MREATETAAAATGLASIKDRVRAAFDAMAEATTTVPRMDPDLAVRLRAPLGRLVSAGQARDAFDQRVAHVEAAARGVEEAGADSRAAVFHVTAMQLAEVSSLVERAGAEADAAFRALLDLAEQGTVATPDIRERLRILASQGIEAVGDLAVAAEGLEAEAAGHAARAGRGAPAAAVGELGWMMALYTMEDERRVHRAAIASAGGAG